MKKVFILLSVLLPLLASSQKYTITHHFPADIWSGIKIKTQIPIASEQMPTLQITAYDAGFNVIVQSTVGWYAYNGVFEAYSATTFGNFPPTVYLSVASGKVNVWLQPLSYFARIKIEAFAQGFQEDSTWFKNWVIVDEALSGTQQTLVPYSTSFRDYVGIGGALSVSGNGSFGSVWVNNEASAGTLKGTKSIMVGSQHTDGYYSSYNASNFSQNAWWDPSTSLWKSHYSKSASGSAVLWKSDGKNGKALSVQIDTTISGNNETLAFTDLFTINKNGVVGIGTTNLNDAGYKLFVESGVRARKVKVDQLTWSDYVFESDYKLRPLNEVEQYITTNKHLPDVPSAQQMLKQGNDLGETQRILLQKIEELTLYIIQQDKKIQNLEHQKNENTAQNEKIREIERILKKGRRL